MPHQSVHASLSHIFRKAGKCNYLYPETMVEEGLVQFDEPQKMAHGREHALADMISSTISLCFNRVMGEVEDIECKGAVTIKGHQHTLETCLPPKRRS